MLGKLTVTPVAGLGGRGSLDSADMSFLGPRQSVDKYDFSQGCCRRRIFWSSERTAHPFSLREIGLLPTPENA